MKNFKLVLTFGLVLAVLIIAFFVSTFLAQKAKQHGPSNVNTVDNQAAAGNTYTNNEFGFSLLLPKDWTDYKVDQSDTDLLFYLPTTSTNYGRPPQKYAPLFNIVAIPLAEAAAQDKKCATPDPYRYWGDCIGVINNLGGNNFYRFAWGSSGIDYPPDFLTEKVKQAETVTKNIKIFDIQSVAPLRTFSRTNAGFAFEYPTGIFTPTYAADIFLPYSQSAQQAIGEIELAHIIKVQYCAPSGKCTPTTTNMKFGAVPLKDQTFASLKKSSVGQELIPQTYGTNKALVLAQGAEGEGIEYYFLENPSGGVLMLYYQYINENIVTKYKSVKDFIPYAEQTHIIEDMVKSVKFIK